jgi:hypothetical protein
MGGGKAMSATMRRLVASALAVMIGLLWGSSVDPDVAGAQGRKPTMMKRFYTGTDGLSHVEEIEVNPKLMMEKIKSVQVGVTQPGTFQDWHPGPERRYIISLTNGGQLEVAEGKVDLPAGTLYYIDDLTGKGHRTANVSKEERVSIQLSFEDQKQIVGPLKK